MSKMTLEDKAHFVIGTGMAGFSGDDAVIGATRNLVPGAAGTTFPLDSLGIPAIVLADESLLQPVLHSIPQDKIANVNITMGYSVPIKLLRKARMSQLRIYGTVQNPFIFCKDDMLKGLDPENTSSSFPLYKTFVFGINASF